MNRKVLTLLLIIVGFITSTYCHESYKTSYGSTLIPEGYYPIVGEQLTKLVNAETINWNVKQEGPFFLGLTKKPNPKALDYPIILLQYVPQEKGADDTSFAEMAMLFTMIVDDRSYEFANRINLDSIAALNVDPDVNRVSFIEPIFCPNNEWITKFNSIFLVGQDYIFVYGLYPIKNADVFYDDYRLVVHNFKPLTDNSPKNNKESISSREFFKPEETKSYHQKDEGFRPPFMLREFFSFGGRIKWYIIITAGAFVFGVAILIVRIFKSLFIQKKRKDIEV